MDPARLYQHLLSSTHRLYAVEGDGALGELAVEAWIGREAISALFEWRIVTVSANAEIALDGLMGQRVTLLTTLAGGGQSRRTGLIRQAEKLGADGSLARYRLTVIPWLWLTTQQRHSQVFLEAFAVFGTAMAFSLVSTSVWAEGTRGDGLIPKGVQRYVLPMKACALEFVAKAGGTARVTPSDDS